MPRLGKQNLELIIHYILWANFRRSYLCPVLSESKRVVECPLKYLSWKVFLYAVCAGGRDGVSFPTSSSCWKIWKTTYSIFFSIHKHIQCSGSMTFWCGSRSADPCLWLMEFFCLLLFGGTFTWFFKDKKSKRSHKTIGAKFFLTIHDPYFWLVDPDPGGSKTCGSGGSGSGTLAHSLQIGAGLRCPPWDWRLCLLATGLMISSSLWWGKLSVS